MSFSTPDISGTRCELVDVERFEYSPADLLLRLALRVPSRPAALGGELQVEAGGMRRAFMPLVACTVRLPGTSDAHAWRASFALAPQLASDPDALFSLLLDEGERFPLGKPHIAGLEQPRRGEARAAVQWPYTVRRRAALFVVSCQLALAPGLYGAQALAAESSGSSTGAATAQEVPPVEVHETAPPPAGGEAPPPAQTPPEQQPSGSEPAPRQPPPTTGETKAPQAPSESSGGHTGEAPGSTQTHGPSPAPPQQSPQSAEAPKLPPTENIALPVPSSSKWTTPSAGKGGKDVQAPAKQAPKPNRRPSSAGPHEDPHRSAARHKGGKPQPPASPEAQPSGAPAGETPPVLIELPPGLASFDNVQPPAYLLRVYKQAARRYHVPWRVLAAINRIETDYGRDLSVSPAGAMGWMQFMPATWREWAVDADRSGHADPYSPRDAIFTAARYLAASGAAHDLPRAIFAYNHAGWYVAEVLFDASRIDTSTIASQQGYALPLLSAYMHELGRTDDGVDIETAPDGAAVYSMTPGIVTAVASDPGGFGPNYPVIEVTGGSLAGQHIYYGHVARALVTVGEHVQAGQPIAIMGHTGDAASLGHGHIEIGFSDASGDPLSHHGETAWTAAGQLMREFLVSLCEGKGLNTR